MQFDQILYQLRTTFRTTTTLLRMTIYHTFIEVRWSLEWYTHFNYTSELENEDK